MSEEKKTTSLDESALEAVSGGAFYAPGLPYFCPVCDNSLVSKQSRVLCPKCGAEMKQISTLKDRG